MAHRLRVAEVIAETPDAHSLVLSVPPALAGAFAYRPGQYLTVLEWLLDVEHRVGGYEPYAFGPHQVSPNALVIVLTPLLDLRAAAMVARFARAGRFVVIVVTAARRSAARVIRGIALMSELARGSSAALRFRAGARRCRRDRPGTRPAR